MMQTTESLALDQARCLEAGPETDALIAAMCGYEIRFYGPDTTDVWRRVSRPLEEFDEDQPVNEFFPEKFRPWQPSTDANAAIEAAEAGGLFAAGYVLRKDCRLTSPWVVSKFEVDEPSQMHGPTAPIALCRAIAVRHVQERDAEANRKTIDGDVP